jgi:hypothetical protein
MIFCKIIVQHHIEAHNNTKITSLIMGSASQNIPHNERLSETPVGIPIGIPCVTLPAATD